MRWPVSGARDVTVTNKIKTPPLWSLVGGQTIHEMNEAVHAFEVFKS